MRSVPFARVVLLLAAFACVSSPARSQSCFYLDFDDDDNPWTLRDMPPSGVTEATFRVILEVPAVPPLGSPFWFTVTEGCCNDIGRNAHYGVRVDPSSVSFDPAFVGAYNLTFTTCICCSSWLISGNLAANGPMVPGERYFIGQATAETICQDYFPFCYPPHDFTFDFDQVQNCPVDHAWMGFECASNSVPGPPAGTTLTDWGKIKSTYR